MGGVDWGAVSIVLAIIGGLFALYKWFISRKDKHRADQNKAQDDKLSEHKERLDRHRELIYKLTDLVTANKDEMHKDFVKIDRFLGLEKTIHDSMKELFNRQSAMAKDLNQSIGQMKATNEAEVKELIKGIQNAIAETAKQPPE